MLAELANCANNNTGNFVELIKTCLRRARLTMRRRRDRVATVECSTFPPVVRRDVNSSGSDRSRSGLRGRAAADTN